MLHVFHVEQYCKFRAQTITNLDDSWPNKKVICYHIQLFKAAPVHTISSLIRSVSFLFVAFVFLCIVLKESHTLYQTVSSQPTMSLYYHPLMCLLMISRVKKLYLKMPKLKNEFYLHLFVIKNNLLMSFRTLSQSYFKIKVGNVHGHQGEAAYSALCM